jgi:hypothetical protein
MGNDLQQPETLPSFHQEKFERSLKPPAKRKQRRKCGCKKVHLLELVSWSVHVIGESGSLEHGGHLTTTNPRKVTCFRCLNGIQFRCYLKHPDDFPKDYILWQSKSLLVSTASRRDPSGFGDSGSPLFPGGSKEIWK